MSSHTASTPLTAVKSWVLVVYIEEDVLSHPIPLEEIEDTTGRNGVEANLQEGQECLARYYVGDRMRRAVIVRRSENQEVLVNYYKKVMKLEKDQETATRNKSIWRYTKVIGGSVLVGGLAVAAAPIALSAAGFSSGGVVAGSLAARLMSMAAIANGGGVAAASAGGWIAALQSAGAAGISATTNAVIGTTAGGLFGLFSSRKKPSEGNRKTKEGNREMKDLRKTVKQCVGKSEESDLDRSTPDHRRAGSAAQIADPPAGEHPLIRHSEDQAQLSSQTDEYQEQSAVVIQEEEFNSDFQSLSLNEDIDNLFRENQRLQEENQCKICMDHEMNTLFEPCGHLCTCQQCASQLRKCPICNQNVRKLHRVYKS